MPQLFSVFLFLFVTLTAQANEHLLRLEAEAAAAEKEASALDAQLKATEAATLRLPDFTRSASYRRFLNLYTRKFPSAEISIAEVLRASQLPETPRGTFVALSPVDPRRPAVFVTSDSARQNDVEAVVTELRGKTTTALLSGRGGLFQSKKNLLMRANSILVGASQEEFKQVVADTERELARLPALAARIAVNQARQQLNDGPLLSAFQKLERAAQGGLGLQRFESRLLDSLPRALSEASKTRAEILKLLAVRTRLEATKKAIALRKQAMEVGKPGDLVGFEVEPSTEYRIGVEYYVYTTDGKTYRMQHVGKNFEDERGDFIPSQDYARLNVALLKAYEARGLSREEFLSIAKDKGFQVTDDGQIQLRRP